VRDFHQLKAWEYAHRLTLWVYEVTRTFPREESFGITSQLRRASSSIAANLAEACGRGGEVEFRRFCQSAKGGASEAEYFLLLARNLGYLPNQEWEGINDLTIRTKKTLSGLIKAIND
jgi:four helix bundle protein